MPLLRLFLLSAPFLLTAAPLSAQLVGGQWETIWKFDGLERKDYLGGSVSGAGDVDRDGFDDVIVGKRWASPGGLYHAGSAYVYSGATGNLIWQFDGQAAADLMGDSVSGAGDVDGDGFDDVIVGAIGADPGGVVEAGSVYVFSLDPFLYTDSATISATSGTPFSLHVDFPSSEAGFAYAILASTAGIGPTTRGGLVIPLTPDNLFNRMLGGWSPPPLQSGHGLLDANGEAIATLSGHPALVPLIGRTIYLAAVSYDPATMTGRLSSIARYLTVVP